MTDRETLRRRPCVAPASEQSLACPEVDEHVLLGASDCSEMAADLADLRDRLALELVRRHPEGIRSLVLDAALPPQGN